MGAKWAKSRRPSQAGRTAVAATLVGDVLPVLVLVGMTIADDASVQRATGGQIPVQGILVGAGLLAVFGVISLVVARNLAKSTVGGQKFCAECQEYMESIRLWTVPLDKTGQAVLHLLDWSLADLSDFQGRREC